MKTWTWRIVLSVTNVALSVGMSPRFYHCLLAHSADLFFAVRCLETVPYVVTNMIETFQLTHNQVLWARGNWVSHLFWEYQLTAFLFWWWVGWKIDLEISSDVASPRSMLLDSVLGLALALLLFFEPQGGPAQGFGWASIPWGIALLCFSLLQLRRGITKLR
jgi:hypothetical protein